jgi:hypothetical protein
MWPFDTLVSTIQTTFSRASTEYNEVHQLSKRLEEENLKLDQQSIIATGLKNMVTNRYHGMTTISSLLAKGREGGYWAWYFALAPNLQNDVKLSSMAWAHSKLSLPNLSIQNVVKVGATAFGTTGQDIQRLQMAGQQRARTEAQFLMASTTASMMITSTLKAAGNHVQHQYGKQFLRGATRTWQATGALAFVYGLGRLADAVHESGPFASHLLKQRDGFIVHQKSQIDHRLKDLVEHYVEHGPKGWMD